MVQAADFFCIVSWHIREKRHKVNNLLETDLTEHSLNWALEKREACLAHCVSALSVQVDEGCRSYS